MKTSLDIENFVLDVNDKNLINGIEIMDSSENLGINKNVLKNVKGVKMSVTYKTNNVYVLLMISFNKSKKKVNVQIPLTLSLGNNVPQKEVMVFG